MKKVTSVDAYIAAHPNYAEPLNNLRRILLKTELEETLKWNAPTYCINGKNVVGFSAFKHHFGLWFFQGVFLKDEENLLVNAQEGKTKALRQMRFKTGDEINEAIILAYVNEAILNQKKGLEIKPSRSSAKVLVPNILEVALRENNKLNTAFEALTPGKQREYCTHIAEAKREATKLSRLEKIIPLILNGSGLYDKYKKC